MTQNSKDAHNQKDEILISYDTSTKLSVPKECIERHSKRKKINYIMCKLEMTKFKNELTLDKHDNQQEQIFVTSPIGGSQYLVYYDGKLYQYLLYQSKKDCQEYIKNFPFLMDWCPEEWVNFQHGSENCAYTHFAWMTLLIWFNEVVVLKVIKWLIQQLIWIVTFQFVFN